MYLCVHLGHNVKIVSYWKSKSKGLRATLLKYLSGGMMLKSAGVQSGRSVWLLHRKDRPEYRSNRRKGQVRDGSHRRAGLVKTGGSGHQG